MKKISAANRIFCLFIIASCILFSACKKEEEEEVINCSGTTPVYSSTVKVIIANNCLSAGCHNSGSINGDYTIFEELKKDAISGKLENRVITNKTMPVSGPLSLADRTIIKCWISGGSLNN